MSSSAERLERIRQEIAARQGGRAADPNEWRPPKAQAGQKLNFKFIVMPPLKPGDACIVGGSPGKAKTDMKELYSFRAGLHWINNKPYGCPRLFDNTECPFCKHGFDLLSETDDPDTRKQIVKAYLPKETHAINVYFPAVKTNPSDIHGKVKWFGVTQKTIWEEFSSCLNRNEADAKGATPEENQAWGFFYEPDESYHFLLNISLKKAGKNSFNDYAGSQFIASTRGPIVRKEDKVTLDSERMTAILAQRHDLGVKFPAPDVKKLAALLAAVSKAQPAEEHETGSGFDDDEIERPKAAAAAATEIETPAVAEIEESAPKAAKPAVKPATKPAPANVESDDELDALMKDLGSDGE